MPRINEIIKQWDSRGIIIEDQFDFASQRIICSYRLEAYTIIVLNGGHRCGYSATADKVLPKLGWMYAIYDTERLEESEARKNIIEYFAQRPIIYSES